MKRSVETQENAGDRERGSGTPPRLRWGIDAMKENARRGKDAGKMPALQNGVHTMGMEKIAGCPYRASFAGTVRLGLVLSVPEGRSGLENSAKILILGALALGPVDLFADAGDGLEEELANIGDGGGVTGGDLISGFEDEQAAEGVVDGSHAAEVGEGPEKLGGKIGGRDGGFGRSRCCVACAECGMRLFARHTATASAGVAVMATDRRIDFRHGETPFSKFGESHDE